LTKLISGVRTRGKKRGGLLCRATALTELFTEKRSVCWSFFLLADKDEKKKGNLLPAVGGRKEVFPIHLYPRIIIEGKREFLLWPD